MFKSYRNAIILSAGIIAGGFFQSASADYSVNNGKLSIKHKQDIVVTLKSNPSAADPIGLEAACLAVTFARMLSSNPLNNVTLFVTLDGVYLADESSAHGEDCHTPFPGDETILLGEHLEKFLKGGAEEENQNNMVVCPLCYNKRLLGPVPDYGVVPGLENPDHGAPKNAISTMVGNADKMLDL